MSRTRLLVINDRGQWKINLNGQHRGPYKTQRDAIRAAVNAAHAEALKGNDAQVLVEGQDNR